MIEYKKENVRFTLLADRPVGSVVAGGIGTLLVAGLWFKWFPALALRDRMTEPTTKA